MLGVFVNTIAVLCGSIIGLLFSRLIPDNLSDFIMKGIGLCTMYIGISGMLSGSNPLVTIISIVAGAILGSGLRIEDGINGIANRLQSRFSRPGNQKSIAEGFISACLLFCIGSMTIVGSLQAGLAGDNTMLFTKSLLDFISSIMFSASLGIGVLFSAGFVLVFQGAIVLAAQAIAPFLSDPVVAEMTCVGSLLILGIGINLTGIGKLKLMNYLPAIFVPIFILRFFG